MVGAGQIIMEIDMQSMYVSTSQETETDSIMQLLLLRVIKLLTPSQNITTSGYVCPGTQPSSCYIFWDGGSTSNSKQLIE